MEKKSTFLPYHVKKHHSTLEMDTFKIILLLSYLISLDKKTSHMCVNLFHFVILESTLAYTLCYFIVFR